MESRNLKIIPFLLFLFLLLLHLIVLVPSKSCPNEGTGRPPICLTFTIIAIMWAIAEILAYIITRATYSRGFSIFVQIFLVTTALFLFMYVPFTVPSRQFNSWSMPYYVCACWTVWCIYFHSSHQDKYLAVSFPSSPFFYLVHTMNTENEQSSYINGYHFICGRSASVCARMTFRKKYKLEPTCCCGDNCLDDCCSMYFCSSCTTIQMHRHTHHENEYEYVLTSTTGLSPDAPEIVWFIKERSKYLKSSIVIVKIVYVTCKVIPRK